MYFAFFYFRTPTIYSNFQRCKKKKKREKAKLRQILFAVLGRCLPGFLSDTFEKVAEISRSFNETGTVGLFDKVKSLKNNIIWSNEQLMNVPDLFHDSVPEKQALVNASKYSQQFLSISGLSKHFQH